MWSHKCTVEHGGSLVLVEALDGMCSGKVTSDLRPHVGYCAFMCLKDELDWGRLNYIQIKRIREVSYDSFDLVNQIN